MSVVDVIKGRDSTGTMEKSPIPKCALLKGIGQVSSTNVLMVPDMVPGTG